MENSLSNPQNESSSSKKKPDENCWIVYPNSEQYGHMTYEQICKLVESDQKILLIKDKKKNAVYTIDFFVEEFLKKKDKFLNQGNRNEEEEESSDEYFGNQQEMGNHNPITHLFSNDSDQQTDLPLAEPDSEKEEYEELFDFNPQEFLGSHPDQSHSE